MIKLFEQQQLWHLDCQLWRSWAIYPSAKTLGLSDMLTKMTNLGVRDATSSGTIMRESEKNSDQNDIFEKFINFDDIDNATKTQSVFDVDVKLAKLLARVPVENFFLIVLLRW